MQWHPQGSGSGWGCVLCDIPGMRTEKQHLLHSMHMVVNAGGGLRVLLLCDGWGLELRRGRSVCEGLEGEENWGGRGHGCVSLFIFGSFVAPQYPDHR